MDFALKLALHGGTWILKSLKDSPEAGPQGPASGGLDPQPTPEFALNITKSAPDPSDLAGKTEAPFPYLAQHSQYLGPNAQLFLETPQAYLKGMLGVDAESKIPLDDATLALQVAEESGYFEQRLLELESCLTQLHSMSLEEKARVLEAVMELSHSYLTLAAAPQANTDDQEFSSEALSALAAESFGILSRFAADDADPALQRLAPFFAGHEALALGEMGEAARKFNEVKAFIPEAAEVLKRLEGDQLRLQNLALIQAWKAYHREAYEAGFNEMHGAVGLMEGIFESQEGTPWYEYFIPFHDPAEQGKQLVRDGEGEFSEMEFYRNWEQKKSLVPEVERKIIQNEAKTIRQALEQISARDQSPLMETAAGLLREKFFAQNLIPGLIQLGDAKTPDPELAGRFLEAAQHLEYGEGFTQFPALAYGLIADLSSDADTVARAQNHFTEWQEAQSGEMGFGDSVGRLLHNINPSAAGEFIPLLLAGGIGGMARIGALKALGQSGITGYKAVALAFGAEVMAEGAALGTIMVGQGALHNNIDESLSSEHIIRSYASSLIMIGGLKGIGRIGQATTMPMVRGLGLLATDGIQSSQGGKIFARSLGHLFGMGGMVGVSHVNQWLGLNPAPQGGTWQSLAHDLFMYWEFNLAHKIIDGFTMGRLKRFQGQQHGEAALREAHLMARSHADRLGFKQAPGEADAVLKTTPQGGLVFSAADGGRAPNTPRQRLLQQLTQATLTRPGFGGGKFAKFIERGEYKEADAYLKKFNLLRPKEFAAPKLSPHAIGERVLVKDYFSSLSEYLAKLPPSEYFGLQRILGEGNEYGIEINGETGIFPQSRRQEILQALKKFPGAKVLETSRASEIKLELRDPLSGEKKKLQLQSVLEDIQISEGKLETITTENLITSVATALVPAAPLSIYATFASLFHWVRPNSSTLMKKTEVHSASLRVFMASEPQGDSGPKPFSDVEGEKTRVQYWLETPPAKTSPDPAALDKTLLDLGLSRQELAGGRRVLSHGIFSDWVLDYHQRRSAMILEMEKAVEKLQEKGGLEPGILWGVAKAYIKLAMASSEGKGRPTEEPGTLQEEIPIWVLRLEESTTLRKARKIFGDIREAHRSNLEVAYLRAQREMEALLETALKILSGLGEILDDHKFSLMIEEVRHLVPIHMIAELDSRASGSFAISSVERFFRGGKGFGKEIFIRPGATLSELFHEILHAADHEFHPDSLIAESAAGRKDLKIPEFVWKEDWLKKKRSFEEAMFFEEAIAFSGQAHLEQQLHKHFGWWNLRRDAWMSGEMSLRPGLGEIYSQAGLVGVFKELRQNAAQYRLGEMKKAWRFAALQEGLGPKKLDQFFWSTQAGNWGLKFRPERRSDGVHFHYKDLDLPKFWDQLAESDPDRLLSQVREWHKDFHLLKRQGEGTGLELLPDQLLPRPLAQPEDPLPSGQVSALSTQPETTQDRVALLAKFRELHEASEASLSRFEAQLALAEQSPAPRATVYFEGALNFLEGRIADREFDTATETLAHLGASLMARGLDTEGRYLLRLFLDYTLGVPEAFTKRWRDFEKIPERDWGLGDMVLLKRSLSTLAPTRAGDFLAQELLGYLRDLSSDKTFFSFDDEGSFEPVNRFLHFSALLRTLRVHLDEFSPETGKKILEFGKSSISSLIEKGIPWRVGIQIDPEVDSASVREDLLGFPYLDFPEMIPEYLIWKRESWGDEDQGRFFFVGELLPLLKALPKTLETESAQALAAGLGRNWEIGLRTWENFKWEIRRNGISLSPPPRGLLDFLDRLPQKGANSLQFLIRGKENSSLQTGMLFYLFEGIYLYRRPEAHLQDLGEKYLQTLIRHLDGPGPVSNTHFPEDLKIPHSPLGRTLLELMHPNGDSTALQYHHPDQTRALVWMEQAAREPKAAAALLKKAERHLRMQEPRVRFSEIPKVEALLHLRRRLQEAYLKSGDLKSARRVYRRTLMLLEEYEAQMAKMLAQGRNWLRTLDPDSPLLRWTRGAYDSPLPESFNADDFASWDSRRSAIEKLLEWFRDGEGGIRPDSVAFRLQFRFAVALAAFQDESLDMPSFRRKFQKILREMEDDVLYRKGHLGEDLLLEILEKLSKEPSLKTEALALTTLINRHFALKRGEVPRKGWEKQKALALKDASGLFRPLAESGNRIDDTLLRSKMALKTGQEILAQGGEIFQTDPESGTDQQLAHALESYFQILEKAPFSFSEREGIYLELCSRLLPHRPGDWLELWDAFPQTFEGLLGTLKDKSYPRVEAFLLKRLAGASPEMEWRPKQAGLNQSLLAGMTLVARFIFKTHPEVLNPEGLGTLLSLRDSLEYRAQLEKIFGRRVWPILGATGRDDLLNFPYRLGQILTGQFEAPEAFQALKVALGEVMKVGSEVSDRDTQDLLGIHHALLRAALLEKIPAGPEVKNFVRLSFALIDRLVTGADLRLISLADTLLSSRDGAEARAKLELYRKLLAQKDLPAAIESRVMEEMNRAGVLSDYIYGQYLSRYRGTSLDVRGPFLEFLRRFWDYDAEGATRLEDYFVVNLLEHPDEIPDFFRKYDRWIKTRHGRGSWTAESTDVTALAIYYYKLWPKVREGKALSPTEFAAALPGAFNYERKFSPLATREFWKVFGRGEGYGSPHGEKVRAAAAEFARRAQQVEDRVRLSKLQLPGPILKLPPVVQFATTRYLQHLPLGVREDLLADFSDLRLEPEEAFRKFFERTGNEKLGQFLGLMKGAMPEELHGVLKDFRSNVRGSRPDEIQAAFMQAWGDRPEDRLKHFDYEMKQAGSVGEVYRGVLPTGTEVRYFGPGGEEITETLDQPLPVALKVLTATRKKRLKDNLKILQQVAEDLKKQSSRFGLRFDPVAVFKDFKKTFLEEMDFRKEVENARAYAAQLPEGLQMPRYFTNLSGANILVTEWIEGQALDQVEDPKLQKQIFDRLGHSTASHVLETGRYYEDPHPDNLLVTEEGKAYLLDFGRLGTLNLTYRKNLLKFFGAILQADPKEVETALRALTIQGQEPRHQALQRQTQEIFRKNGKGMDSLFHTVEELFQAAFETGYYVRPEYTTMLKAFLTLQGVAEENPELGEFEISRYLAAPFFRAYAQLKE